MAVIHATGVQDATQARRALIERIEQVLPQTQCRQCGFDGCTPYAEAIADQQAAINRCPPGGLSTLAQLGQLTGRLETALDVSRGQSKPLQVAVIDESQCIGCTLCIQACPVDAIIGAARQMHVVRALECSGCEICIAPCPVDCISMRTASLAWDPSRAASARARHDGRAQRAERIAALNASKRRQRLEQHSREARDGRANSVEAEQAEQRKQTMLAKALARARARRAPADRPMAADGEP